MKYELFIIDNKTGVGKMNPKYYNHPLKENLRQYNKRFGEKLELAMVDTTADRLNEALIQAIRTNTPIIINSDLPYLPIFDTILEDDSGDNFVKIGTFFYPLIDGSIDWENPKESLD